MPNIAVIFIVLVLILYKAIQIALKLYRDYRRRNPKFKAFMVYRNDYHLEAKKIFGDKWIVVQNIDSNLPKEKFDGLSDIEIKQKILEHAKILKLTIAHCGGRAIVHYKTMMGNFIVIAY